MGPQGYVCFRDKDGSYDQLELLTPLVVLPALESWVDVGVALWSCPASCYFPSLLCQAKVAFDIKSSFHIAEIRGTDVVVTHGSNMDAICTVCNQRYGSHSGLACSGTSGPPPPSQHFLFKGTAQAVSDPEWYSGNVTATLGGCYASVDTSKGVFAVPIKDQSPSSQCFMYAAKASPSATAPQPATLVKVESLEEANVLQYAGQWAELQLPSRKSILRLPSALLSPDLTAKLTQLPTVAEPAEVAASSQSTQLLRLLEVISRCSLPYQAKDLFFVQAVADFTAQPSYVELCVLFVIVIAMVSPLTLLVMPPATNKQ
jgi:hypothetical protein